MATTTINIRVNTDLKQSAETLFADLGLNMSSAINLFLKSAVSREGIPFEIKRCEPNATTRAALEEHEQMKNNHKSYKRYKNFDEVLADA